MIFFQLPHHRSDSSVSILFTVGYIPYGKFRDMNSKDSYHSLSFPKNVILHNSHFRSILGNFYSLFDVLVFRRIGCVKTAQYQHAKMNIKMSKMLNKSLKNGSLQFTYNTPWM